MTTHDIAKALEVWSLQSLLNTSMILGILALGLALIQKYLQSLEEYLTLKVSIEIWKVATTLIVDILLIIVVAVGFMVLNPDIMVDIKVAVPFVPIATIIFSIALILRLFHGGHQLSSPNFLRCVWLMVIANVINVLGYTFVMEAASREYLEKHPSAFWTFLKLHLRSNSNLGLSHVTFWVCFPILVLVFIWGIGTGLKQLSKLGRWGNER